MSKIFFNWAVNKYPNDADLGEVFRRFYYMAAEGGNTEEACRAAEEKIMADSFKSR